MPSFYCTSEEDQPSSTDLYICRKLDATVVLVEGTGEICICPKLFEFSIEEAVRDKRECVPVVKGNRFGFMERKSDGTVWEK